MSVTLMELCVVPMLGLPLYILFVSFFFITSINVKCLKPAVSSVTGLSLIAAPLLILALLTHSLRFFEGPALLSQLFFSKSTVRACLVGSLSVLAFLFTTAVGGAVAPAAMWALLGCFSLFLSFAFVLSSALTNLFSYFFFFEVVGLLLLLTLICVGDIGSTNRVNGLNNPAIVAEKFAATGSRLNAYLAFLWISALALVSLTWSVTGLLRLGLSLDTRVACVLVLPAKGGHVAFYAGVILLSLGLKVAALPAHGWLFAFYSNLPLNSILSYFQLYYLFFLVMLGRLVHSTLGDLAPYWIGGLSVLVLIFATALMSLVGEVGRVKHALAASSILNTTLIFFIFLP